MSSFRYVKSKGELEEETKGCSPDALLCSLFAAKGKEEKQHPSMHFKQEDGERGVCR